MVHFIKKRLQVFVSSTFLDLKEERQAAVTAILEAGHIPAGMELFTSGDESQMEVIKQWIEDSDIYFLILGGRYGSVEPTSGKSYTHLEYEYAMSIQKPLFVCVMKDDYLDGKIQGGNYKNIREQSNIEKLQNFKNIVMSKMVFQCNGLIELKYNVLQKMMEYGRDDNLTGWIRANESSDSALLSEEIAKLSQENRELRDRLEKMIQAGNQSILMLNGFSFDEICEMMSNIAVSESDLSDVSLLHNENPNSLAIDTIEKIKTGEVKNALDLLMSISDIILRQKNSSHREIQMKVTSIASIPRMVIAFDASILEYYQVNVTPPGHIGGRAVKISGFNYTCVKFTEIGEKFIKNIKLMKIKNSIIQ